MNALFKKCKSHNHTNPKFNSYSNCIFDSFSFNFTILITIESWKQLFNYWLNILKEFPIITLSLFSLANLEILLTSESKSAFNILFYLHVKITKFNFNSLCSKSSTKKKKECKKEPEE